MNIGGHIPSRGVACLLLVAAAPLGIVHRTTAQDGKASWAERFPVIAARVGHLDQRMKSPDERVRRRVLTQLTYFCPRDSKHFPPFLRALLDDPSPKLRWEAVHCLWEHNHFLERKELPASLEVPLVGEFAWQDPKHLERFRNTARTPEAVGGWAIHALGIVGDRDSIPLANNLLSSNNVFTRFSAAMALVQLGEKKAGIDALHKMTDAADDDTGFYRCRAAEVLVRLGDKKAITVLIQELAASKLADSSYSAAELLADLTGQYFTTAAEWRAWLKRVPRGDR